VKTIDFVLDDIADRWIEEVSKAEEVIVLCPFVTSATAEEVLTAEKSRVRKLFTRFSRATFLAGSSSLSTLQQLVENGVEVFHLQDLHAKILFIPGQFASIGSQNLTNNGRSQKEATVTFTGKKELDVLSQQIHMWMSIARPISKSAICQLKLELEPLIQKRQLQNRELKKELQKSRLRKMRIRNARILAQMTQSTNSTDAKVLFDPSNGGRYSLRGAGQGNWLTVWLFQGKDAVHLDRLGCCLCMLGTGEKFGFARVGETQITFIGSAVRQEHLLINGEHYTVTFQAEWKKKRKGHNLTIKLQGEDKPPRNTTLLRCWFGVDRLRIIVPPSSLLPKTPPSLQKAVDWIGENERTAELLFLHEMLKPFRYELVTSKPQANEFFGKDGTRYNFRLHASRHGNILVASRK
jgi:hypothetical protein